LFTPALASERPTPRTVSMSKNNSYLAAARRLGRLWFRSAALAMAAVCAACTGRATVGEGDPCSGDEVCAAGLLCSDFEDLPSRCLPDCTDLMYYLCENGDYCLSRRVGDRTSVCWDGGPRLIGEPCERSADCVRRSICASDQALPPAPEPPRQCSRLCEVDDDCPPRRSRELSRGRALQSDSRLPVVGTLRGLRSGRRRDRLPDGHRVRVARTARMRSGTLTDAISLLSQGGRWMPSKMITEWYPYRASVSVKVRSPRHALLAHERP
jgi:hypothetical protein